MVQTAASIAAAASTALPPCWKIMAPAVAPSGLPVTAIQWEPWSWGFSVRWAAAGEEREAVPSASARTERAR